MLDWPSSKRCGCQGCAGVGPIIAANACRGQDEPQTRWDSDLVSPLEPVSSRPSDPPCALSPPPCIPQSLRLPPQTLPSSLESRITVVTLLARSPQPQPNTHAPTTNSSALNSRGEHYVIQPAFATTAPSHPQAHTSREPRWPRRETKVDARERRIALAHSRRNGTGRTSRGALGKSEEKRTGLDDTILPGNY